MTFDIPRPEWVDDDLVADRGANAGFQMYTTEGNDECAKVVLSLARALEARPMFRSDAVALLQESVTELAKVHPEVHDTEPEWAIVDAVNVLFETVGFVKVDRDDLD